MHSLEAIQSNLKAKQAGSSRYNIPVYEFKGHQDTYIFNFKIGESEAAEILKQTGYKVQLPFPLQPGQEVLTSFAVARGTNGLFYIGYALKQKRFVGIKVSHDSGRFKNNIAFYMSLNRKALHHVLPLKDYHQTVNEDGKPVIYQVMEIAGLGSVDKIKDSIISKGILSDRILFCLTQGLLHGLAEMHQAHFYHLDVKPHNLVVRQDGHVFLIDFDCAVESNTALIDMRNAPAGDPGYYPPECQRGELFCDASKIDAFSAGLTLLYLGYSGNLGFAEFGSQDLENLSDQFINEMEDLNCEVDHKNHAEAIQRYYEQQLAKVPHLQNPEPDSFWSLVSSLLALDPQKRLSPAEALKHPWFLKFKADSSAWRKETIEYLRETVQGHKASIHFEKNVENVVTRLKHTLAMHKKVYGKESAKVVTTLCDLGEAVEAINTEEAAEYYMRALTIRDKLNEKESIEVARILSNLGRVLIDPDDSDFDGRKDEAVKHLERALSILEKKCDKADPKVAMALNDLGEALRKVGDTKKAVEYLERALIIKEAHYGKEAPSVRYTLENLGEALDELGDAKKAVEYLERALTIKEAHYGKEDPDITKTYSFRLGRLHSILGNPEKAVQYLERGLALEEKIRGKETSEVAEPLIKLCVVFYTLGDQKKMAECLERVIVISERWDGKNYSSLQWQGEDFFTLDNAKKAPYLDCVIGILEQKYGKEHGSVAAVLRGKASTRSEPEVTPCAAIPYTPLLQLTRESSNTESNKDVVRSASTLVSTL